jgi:peptide/nickel transport system permease protein
MRASITGGDMAPLPNDLALSGEREKALRLPSRAAQFWRRFSANRMAVVGTVLLVGIIAMVVCAPLITPGVTPTTQFDLPPYSLKNLNYPQYGPSFANFPARLFGLTSGGFLYHFHSILAGVAYGGRESLAIGGLAALLSSTLGVLVGAVSGYFGGWVDALLMRVTDLFLALPFLPLTIAIIIASDVEGVSLTMYVLIFGLLAWANVARLVRATYLTLRDQDYAEAARAAGVGAWRIIFRHLLPNAVAPIIVATTANIAAFIIAESTIDFFDLGHAEVPGGDAQTWGNMIAQGNGFIISGNWWWVFFPGLFIMLTAVSVYLIGDGLRDALDVRSARR